jgi:RNA polymerase sigma factor (sigma-70 family)
MTGLPLSMVEHPELIAQTRAGDDAAFAALVRQYQPAVFRWALAIAGDEDDANDILQEVFVRVHRKLTSFRGDGSFDAWLYRITRRIAFRMQSAHGPVPTSGDDVYLTDPGARVDRQRAVALVKTIAATLPLRQREVFVLCDLEGRSPAEAASMLEMKDVSVRASLFKARATIRRTILASHPSFRDSSL